MGGAGGLEPGSGVDRDPVPDALVGATGAASGTLAAPAAPAAAPTCLLSPAFRFEFGLRRFRFSPALDGFMRRGVRFRTACRVGMLSVPRDFRDRPASSVLDGTRITELRLSERRTTETGRCQQSKQ